ncbi:MAG TPA: ribonuclease R [Bacilli bacterium]|nr:ribonuclease R [Bacilli bacterium]
MKEQIIKALTNIHEAKELMEINDILGYKTAEEYQTLTTTIEELVAEFIVFKTKKDKYILLNNCPNLKVGKISVNKKGFGFILQESGEDIYVDQDNLGGAIDEDMVLCEVIPGRIKREGKVIKIVKRDLKNIVGEIIFVKDKILLKLDDEKKDLTIEIDKKSAINCVEGHKVLVKVTNKISNKRYLAEVAKVLGHKDDPGVDILSIAYKYGIYDQLEPDVIAEVELIPTVVNPDSLNNRRDLTEQVIFTIDGDDTKDIDDAISIEKIDNGYRLGVHIADVSYYVKENTALGADAYQRGTSSYLADTVIPMLPHKLSNGICSLNENELRLTLSCVMDISLTAQIMNYEIFESYIKSKKKMTYKKVNDIIINNVVAEGYEPYVEQIKMMADLAKILRQDKIKRGYIDFDLDEPKIVQDENGKAIDVIRRERFAGEMLIEDFMIAANETVATHIYNMDLPFIYRIHENPDSEKISEFLKLVKLLGYKIENKISITPKGMQNLLNELNEKPEFAVLSGQLLRSMRKAEYSKDNRGHFGLASKNYTHFTSPIRRFPDLTVHRLLRTYLFKQDLSMTTINTLDKLLVEIAEHSSERELAAVKAERDVVDMKTAEYMESHLGEEYEGMIISVVSFGFFVQLPNLIEGLVHVNTLKGDYFTYLPESLAIIGKSTKKKYALGDMLKVKVVAANKAAGTTDFEVIDGEENGNPE